MSRQPKQPTTLNEAMQFRTDLRSTVWLVVIVATLATSVVGFAAVVRWHDHDDEYMPRGELEARLDSLHETATRIEALLEKRNGNG